jgi:hypothetical protein
MSTASATAAAGALAICFVEEGGISRSSPRAYESRAVVATYPTPVPEDEIIGFSFSAATRLPAISADLFADLR